VSTAVAIKKGLKKLRKGMVGETVRDYANITNDYDKVKARLRHRGDQFRFVMSLDHRERGRADFVARVNTETLEVLRLIANDIKRAKENGGKDKDLRLRFRDGQLDLVITYKYYSEDRKATRQRTAPVSERTIKLLD